MSLNQNISKCFLDIQNFKTDIFKVKGQLSNVLHRDKMHKMNSLFEKNNENIKISQKDHLFKKFQWIKTKYYNTENGPKHQDEDSCNNVPAFKPHLPAPPAQKITCINTDELVSEDIESLLAMGPNFALTPVINRRTEEEIKVSFAESMFKMRWKEYFKNASSCNTLYREIKTLSSFQSSFVSAPPSTGVECEGLMVQFQNLILNMYKNKENHQPGNLNRTQLKGLKKLKEDKSQISTYLSIR